MVEYPGIDTRLLLQVVRGSIASATHEAHTNSFASLRLRVIINPSPTSFLRALRALRGDHFFGCDPRLLCGLRVLRGDHFLGCGPSLPSVDSRFRLIRLGP